MAKKPATLGMPKYQELFESLKADILLGRYKPGQKLPSEAALVMKSGASRITVTRAVHELQRAGLVDRVAGSGTYVRDSATDRRQHVFGLLIPDLGKTEIFEPLCRAIINAPMAAQHALLWGHVDPLATKQEQAFRLCDQFIARKVSGVFYAPLEFEANAEEVNRKVLKVLRQNEVPVVLLDRRLSHKPDRNRPDLVGINNRQAAYAATDHLIQLGCKKIGFLGYHGSASTISERIGGYKDALLEHGLRPLLDVGHLENEDESPAWSGRRKLDSIEAFVCVNDRVAGELMQILTARKVRVPQDIRLVGIDDVSYADLLPVPLTTVRQPIREIGEAAMQVMIERIRTPHMPPREILLDGSLVVRKSCGAGMKGSR